jgi:hypothetical protein
MHTHYTGPLPATHRERELATFAVLAGGARRSKWLQDDRLETWPSLNDFDPWIKPNFYNKEYIYIVSNICISGLFTYTN